MVRERKGRHARSRAEPPAHGPGRRASTTSGAEPVGRGGEGAGRGGDGWWEALKPGDPVEMATGEPIGELWRVASDALWVRDPTERRELLIPRSACEPRPQGGVRVRVDAVRAAGEGPERYVRRGDLADEWVPEQTQQGREVTIEGESPLEARRTTRDGEELVADETDVGAAEEEQPTEVG